MKTILLIAALIGISAIDIPAAPTLQKDFSDFRQEGIAQRVTSLILPGEREVSQLPIKAPATVGKNRLPISLRAPYKVSEVKAQEKMDSVVRTSVDGEPVSLQTFTYTDTGKYLRANNFILNNKGSWELYSYYNYEYDAADRLIMSEEINVTDEFQNQRYEYGYNGNSDNYAWDIYYSPNYETGEMEPLQKGEYQYDNEGRPIDQTFFYWDSYTNEWIIFGRETVSFDDLGRQTSYYTYVQNDSYTGLVGDRGEEYIYVGDTDTDAEVDGFVWENDAWLKYERHIYTYEDGRLLKNEFLYWNRAAQDWSGNDTYGMYDNLFLNEYTVYTYDESGRLTSMKAYSMNSAGTYINSSIDSYTYADLENGHIERVREQQVMWQGPYLSMIKKEIQHFNAFGAETYYKNYSWLSGQERATDEQIRDIDDNNCYHGGVFYGFTDDEANTRYGQSKEEFGYPADWDHVNETPSYGMHWRGTGNDTDDSWVETTRDEFVWHDIYLIGNTHYEWENGEPHAQASYLFDYDYTVLAEDIWAWPMTRERTPYKLLICRQNYDADGDGIWDTDGYYMSYIDTYYYSMVDQSNVKNIISQNSEIETDRFDLSGRRLSAPVKGVNIVKYSDGSVRKVLVK